MHSILPAMQAEKEKTLLANVILEYVPSEVFLSDKCCISFVYMKERLHPVVR